MKQLDLFKKSQPSDLQLLDDMVSIQYYEDVASHGQIVEQRMPFRDESRSTSHIDWDIKFAHEAGDKQRVQELLQIKCDMYNGE